MLPAPQMHPCPVSSSPAYDAIVGALPIRRRRCAPGPNYEDSLSYCRHSNDAFMHRRSLPIRVSKPFAQSYHLPSTHLLSLSEHKLRRKTPTGTLDAGYDGSPFLYSLAPPLKHILLPALACLGSHDANTSSHDAPIWAVSHSPFSYHGLQEAGNQLKPELLPWPSDQKPTPPNFFPRLNSPSHAPWGQLDTKSEPAHVCGCGSFACSADDGLQTSYPYVSTDRPLTRGRPFLQPDLLPGRHDVDTSLQAFTLNNAHSKAMSGVLPVCSVQSSILAPELSGNSAPDYNPFELARINSPHWKSIDQSSTTGSVSFLTNCADCIRVSERVFTCAYQCYRDLDIFLQQYRGARSQKASTEGAASHTIPVHAKRLRAVPNHLPSWQRNGPAGLAGLCLFDSNPEIQLFSKEANLDTRKKSFYTLPSSSLTRQVPIENTSQSLPFAPPGHQAPLSGLVPIAKEAPILHAQSSLDTLTLFCGRGGWKWLDGMLLAGCICYALARYDDAVRWFSMIIATEPRHVEAIANMAATLYCLRRYEDAERHWLKAVALRPGFLEPTEHLVGLVYRRRRKQAVEIISSVQQALVLHSEIPSGQSSAFASIPIHPLYPGGGSDRAGYCPRTFTHQEGAQDNVHFRPKCVEGFGSSGYALPNSENGRFLALVHTKGTMLFGLKDIQGASEAFEEAVLIGVGRVVDGVRDLVRCIQTTLSPRKHDSAHALQDLPSLSDLMLPPEKARQTVQLVFPKVGELPGLVCVRDRLWKRAAVQTASNSLLSLAKIFQDAMSNGNADPIVAHRSASVSDILALYYLSLSLQESPSTANNVGILLAGIQQKPTYLEKTSVRCSQPSLPGIKPGSSLALALEYYNYGLQLDPKHVHLHTNLGSLLKDVGQLDLAIQMYERAVSCDGKFDIALTNLANAVKDKGRIKDAITFYRRAVISNPNFSEAVCGLFTALNSVCNWRGRGGVIIESGKYDRWHVGDHGELIDGLATGRGSGLTQRVVGIITQQLEEASRWGQHTLQESVIRALSQQFQYLCDDTAFNLEEALRKWAGKPWEGSNVLCLIERATRMITRRWYMELYTFRRETSSPYLRPWLPPNLTIPPTPTVLPFHTFTCPLTPGDIRKISQRNAIRISCSTLRSPWLPTAVYPPPPPPNPQLNIGYLSSDFNNHPLAHLMQSVFGLHDPHRVRAFCYATTLSDGSAHRRQIEIEAPVFRDVSNLTPEKLIEQIVQDKIHILVNLNGYTRGARNEIFAARPAPVQMSFMGFAGSMGAEWCDYILADETAIPRSTLRPWRSNVSIQDLFEAVDRDKCAKSQWMYSENIIFCRDTFFCCDHAQSSDREDIGQTWDKEEGLRWRMRKELFPEAADDAIILGNFNQLYKIEPTTFRSWLRILGRVPRAILWLLRFPEAGENNLRATAELWAGPEVAKRIIFSNVAPKSQHIARARVCDLFLDTPECNAHTTAADVLWSSTPLLTFPRYPYKMCSRMAASILRGALPRSDDGRRAAEELIAGSEIEYEETAIRLAGGLQYVKTDLLGCHIAQGRLAEIRKLLWETKRHCGLFNTRRWVDEVEKAYEEAWRRWVGGIGGDIYL